MHELMESQAFKYYVFCATALALNPLILGGLTGGWRGKYKSPATPEDEKLSGNPFREDVAPEVARVQRAHRNALENIPIALVTGLVYVLAGASPTMALGFMGVIALFRWLHSIFYLNAVQPWRTASFGIAAVANIAMIIHTVVLALR